jgi:hypothetical protein
VAAASTASQQAREDHVQCTGPRRIAAGNVSAQAVNGLRMVAISNPEPLAGATRRSQLKSACQEPERLLILNSRRSALVVSNV